MFEITKYEKGVWVNFRYEFSYVDEFSFKSSCSQIEVCVGHGGCGRLTLDANNRTAILPFSSG